MWVLGHLKAQKRGQLGLTKRDHLHCSRITVIFISHLTISAVVWNLFLEPLSVHLWQELIISTDYIHNELKLTNSSPVISNHSVEFLNALPLFIAWSIFLMLTSGWDFVKKA